MRDTNAEYIVDEPAREEQPVRATREAGDLSVPDDLITPREVASLFCVNPKTVTRWAVAGRLTAYRTLGGHRRFSRAQVEQLLCVQERAS